MSFTQIDGERLSVKMYDSKAKNLHEAISWRCLGSFEQMFVMKVKRL